MARITKLLGKIYNANEQEILDLYKDEGLHIGENLRGDFHLEIVDGKKTMIVSDFAGSKSAGFFPPNTTMLLEDGKPVAKKNNHWISNLNYSPPQGPTPTKTYDKLFEAIDDSIRIRLPEEDFLVPLSGGYDSGSIAAGLCKMGVKHFSAVSIAGNESKKVLEDRWEVLNELCIDTIKLESDGPLSTKQYAEIQKEFKNNERILEAHRELLMERNFNSISSHYVLAKQIPDTIILSGMGADEVLKSKDWQLLDRFMALSQIAYNCYNIDSRFPLLDPTVFKEYWALDFPLRRRHKQPLEKYIASKGFPLPSKKKVGFYIFDNY